MFKKCEIGINDEYGTPIKEGDILRVNSYGTGIYEEDGLGRIEYKENMAMFAVVFDTIMTDFDHLSGRDCEIVGSVYDGDENR